MNIEIKKKGRRPSNKPSAEELGKLYKTMTAKELADHYSVPVYTVKNWIYAYRHKGV